MRATRPYFLFMVLAALVSTVTLISCSSGSSSGGANSYFGTQSPGDAWSWTINRTNGTFSGTNNTTGFTYSGTFTTLTSDYLKFTFTASTDSNVAVGSVAYAIEFPGTALLLKPAGTTGSVIVAAAQGPCPSPATYNWVKVANQTWNVNSDPAFGTAALTGTASSPTINAAQYLLSGVAATPPSATFSGSCSNGVITATGATFGVTPSGVFIGDQGTNGGIVGMLQPSAKIGTAALLQAGRQFRGFGFLTHPPNIPNTNTPQDRTQAIWGTTTGDGTVSVGEYTDALASGGIQDTCPNGQSCATLSSWSEVNPGEFTASMNGTNENNQAFTLIVNQINGKFMVFGISENTAGSGNNSYPFLVVLMEQ